MLVKIEKSKLFGKAVFPPSKSDSHRLVISAALAEGESEIRNVSSCDDLIATMESLCALGVRFEVSGDDVKVFGIDIKNADPSDALKVRESGSTLRFLIPAALLTGKTISFTGAKRLFQRPLSVYADIAKNFGFDFVLSDAGLEICGSLVGADYRVPGDISSQFISGLLFALPLLECDSRIIIKPPFESRPYVEMTLESIRKFGIKAEFSDEFTIEVSGRQRYIPTKTSVEGDWSGGAFLFALKFLHDEIDVEGYNTDSIQGDKICLEYFEKLRKGYCELDISDCPDLGPILFAVAAYFGGARFTGTKRLKIKESDRAEAMKCELEKFGARVTIDDDFVSVSGGDLHKPSEVLSGHGDHRIVMSLAVLATVIGAEIDGAEAVKKSYPDFFGILKNLGANTETSDD